MIQIKYWYDSTDENLDIGISQEHCEITFNKDATSYEVVAELLKILKFATYAYDGLFLSRLEDYCVDNGILPEQFHMNESYVELSQETIDKIAD